MWDYEGTLNAFFSVIHIAAKLDRVKRKVNDHFLITRHEMNEFVQRDSKHRESFGYNLSKLLQRIQLKTKF